jgi:hypothetical protein
VKIANFAAAAGLCIVPCGAVWADDNPYNFAQPFEIAQTNGTVQVPRTESAPPVTPPEPQRWSLSLGGLYTHREGETAGWVPNFEVNYLATDRLQLHFMVPMAFDSVNGGATRYGVGDIEMGVRYRFLDDDPTSWQPAIAVYPLLDLPSGDKDQNLGTGDAHAFLPLWHGAADQRQPVVDG